MTKKFILTVLLSAFMGGISAQISLRPYVGLTLSNFGFAGSGYDSYYESGGDLMSLMTQLTKRFIKINFVRVLGCNWAWGWIFT